MTLDELEQMRVTKFNDWGQRLPLATPDVVDDSEEYLLMVHRNVKRGSSPAVRSAFFVNEITNCQGFEFVAFSNARIDQPVKLPYSVVLFPCFLPQLSKARKDDPLAIATLRMEQAARFVYDGWIPIEDFSDLAVRTSLRHINEALATFFLVSQSHFSWEPKYYLISPRSTVYEINSANLNTIEALASLADGLGEEDRTAIFRSIAWLAQAGEVEDVKAKFLFNIVAIESLAIYIEDSAESDSPLSILCRIRMTRSERRLDRESCISQILELAADNPTRAIQEAYFACVVPIKRRLKDHLERLMGEDDYGVRMFFQESGDGRDSLYDLRHKIAHGTLDSLDEQDVMRIESRIDDAERFALRYIWAVLQKCFYFYNNVTSLPVTMNFDLLYSVLSKSRMYKGPVDMATIYTSQFTVDRILERVTDKQSAS